MNSTNRALNRTLVIVVGFVLLVLGAAAAAGAAVPDWTRLWRDTAKTARSRLDTLTTGTALANGHSWVLIAVAVAALAVVLVMIMFIVRQGGGRTGRLIEVHGAGRGVATIDASVAAQALEQEISSHDVIVGAHVSAYRIRGTVALAITVSARRGAAPADIRSIVDGAVRAWDSVLGSEIPTVVRVSPGIVARVSEPVSLRVGTVA